MKARKKGTQEWKEYNEVFGPHGEFIGLETLGYTKSVDEIIAEMGIDVANDPFARSRIQPEYMSAVLPLECFDLWEEPNWSAFRIEASKDILCAMIGNKDTLTNLPDYRLGEIEVSNAIFLADELIRQLKEEEK